LLTEGSLMFSTAFDDVPVKFKSRMPSLSKYTLTSNINSFGMIAIGIESDVIIIEALHFDFDLDFDSNAKN
jgi:hypothetical protein